MPFPTTLCPDHAEPPATRSASPRWLAAVLAIATACGHGEPTPAPQVTAERVERAPRATVRTLTADEVLRTASGATLAASAGWKVESSPDQLRLITPEGDLSWTHVELAARDRETALAAGWARASPGFALAVGQTKDLPTGDGWEAASQIKYVPGTEGRVALAMARLSRATWYLELIDGSAAALDRRLAQLLRGVKSLSVPGLDKESFAGRSLHPIDVAAVDRFVTAAMAAARVPGVAVAIVERGKLVTRGWGVAELGKPAKVDAGTLFMIGSTAKALTTLMMARLVDAGTIRWDTRVRQLLADFAVGDADLTRAITLRDTVCMCSGMPRDDDWMFSFDYEQVSPEERIAGLAGQKPTTRPGETWQYSNQMVATGGFAAARAYLRGAGLGPAYDWAMAELVFAPLGMTATTFDFGRVARGDHAVPHARELRGALVAQPLSVEQNAVAVRPAGGAWSTARDMARVLQLELGGGALDGKQLVSPQGLAARRAPQIKITDEMSYGLGLFIERDHGALVVGHPGNNVGFTTDLFFLPEYGVGAVVLTNAGDANAFRTAMRRHLLELWFDGRPRAEPELAAALASEAAQAAQRVSRLRAEPDRGWFDPLLGAWAAPHLGRIELRRDRGAAVLDAGEWIVAIAEEQRPDGSRQLVTTGAPWPGLVLVPQKDGAATTLRIDQGGQQAYVFVRAPR